MDAVLLDTDVFSFFLRRDTRSRAYEAAVKGKLSCLSFASVAELRFGAIAAGWQDRRCRQLEEAIAQTVVLPPDNQTTRLWAEIRASRQACGRPIASEDCWVAAVALRHHIVLATHNARDYELIPDLKLYSHS